MYNLQEIEASVKAGRPVSVEELIYLFKNNNAALWAFLIKNNPGNINNSLRHGLTKIGITNYSELGFEPNPQALSKIIQMNLQKGESKELLYVLQNFELNTTGLDPRFVKELITAFNF